METEAQWWERWWKEDYSWAGLAKREWQGYSVTENGFLVETETGAVYGTTGFGAAMSPSPSTPPEAPGGEGAAAPRKLLRKATLQDYWRADPATGRLRRIKDLIAAGELITQPLNGTAVPPPLEGVAVASDGDEDIAAPDGAFHTIHLPLAWRDGTATGKANWPKDALNHILRPRLAAAGETTWKGPSYDRKPSESDRRAQLTGAVLLAFEAEALSLLPDGERRLSLDCTNALFVWHCVCSNTTLVSDTHFTGARFIQEAVFADATFTGVAGFEDVKFTGDAAFTGATFTGEAGFKRATFTGDAWFEGATFTGDSGFSGATFMGHAGFRSATFTGDARFWNATFTGDAGFRSATFTGGAGFKDVTFAKPAIFRSIFKVASDFTRAAFAEIAWFDGAEFEGDMDFTAAVFQRLASFEGISWPAAAGHWHGAFNQALFHGTLNITESGLKAFAAFDGATLERGLQIDEVDEAAAKRTFRAERAAAIKAADETFDRNARLRQLERGCRVLKLAMEKASNKSREQLFYRFELQARRAQTGLPLGEKTFSGLYALASDYGASMWRPLLALAFLIALFAGVFWAFAAVLDPFVAPQLLAGPWNAQLWSALDFSWANVFKPLQALGEASTKDGSMMRLMLTEAGDGYAFGVRALATLQSLLAIVLAFLFALAVRRRFQIN